MSSRYDLKDLDLPRMSGFPLKMFVFLLELPLLGPVLAKVVAKQGGLTAVREGEINETPTLYPIHRTETGSNISEVHPRDLESLLDQDRHSSAGHDQPGIRDIAQAYRSGANTPSAVAERVLEAIEASNDGDLPIRAMVFVDKDDLMEQARESERRVASGSARSIFEGVPVAVKDEIDQVPYPTTGGAGFLSRGAVSADATVVRRLREAGALLIGKSNMHQIGIVPTGANPEYGYTRNPFDPTCYSGGSSSGSGAAVAAGICPVALGADGGGSVRIPAALCGVNGMIGTFGRVSEHGAMALDWTVAHIGPLAATAEDTLLTYGVIAGPDREDPLTLEQPIETLEGWSNTDLSGVRLGVYRDWFEHCDPEVLEVCNEMLSTLESFGAELVEIEIPELNLDRVSQVVIIIAEMATAMMPFYKDHRRDFALDVRINLALAHSLTARDYLRAQQFRSRTIRNFLEAFNKVDLIVNPTTAIAAPTFGKGSELYGESDLSLYTKLMRFVLSANTTGMPAMTFPAGYDSRGLPVGFHVMARPWEEMLMFRAAMAAETVVERRRPKIYTSLLGDH